MGREGIVGQSPVPWRKRIWPVRLIEAERRCGDAGVAGEVEELGNVSAGDAAIHGSNT